MKANTTEYKRAFVEKNYARISVTIPKMQENRVKEHAQSVGESVNGLINVLLRADMGLTDEEWRVPGAIDNSIAVAQSVADDEREYDSVITADHVIAASLYARGIDIIRSHDPQLADSILRGDYKLPEEDIIAIAKYHLMDRAFTTPTGIKGECDSVE